jgi:hypothetical protein
MVLRLTVAALACALLSASCTSSGDDDEPEPTAPPVTTVSTTSTAVTSTEATTSTTSASISTATPPQYQIVSRTPIEEGGDEVVELFPPVGILHVVDDEEAAIVVVDPDAPEESETVLADHYLARLDDGFTITYLGPFAASGTAVLGS